MLSSVVNLWFVLGYNVDGVMCVCACVCVCIDSSAVPLYNAALNKPAFLSSLYRFSNPVASLANDGNYGTTHIVSGFAQCAHSEKELNPWWAVDLGEELHVYSVYLTNRGDCCGANTVHCIDRFSK